MLREPEHVWEELAKLHKSPSMAIRILLGFADANRQTAILRKLDEIRKASTTLASSTHALDELLTRRRDATPPLIRAIEEQEGAP